MVSAATAVIRSDGLPAIPVGDKHLNRFVRLPRPLSRTYVWTTTLVGPLFVVVVNGIMLYLLYGEAHLHWPPNIFLYLATAALVHKIVRDAARRRGDNIRRMLIVAECNHHIRNSLQSMVGLAYAHGDYAEQQFQIAQAVERIQNTLTDILPGVNDYLEG